ncbi:Hypothetical protein SSO2203 [Saccharolobus solfataricus P2]|uniref:Uncharacterized protein n=2 Tax=Saccharolobus solfataricus TaxID=2287 RepID=Q97WL3_SACS2|nr:Hypothetical protein SSO2203 [Saccharolobus solfataricus P2]SAI85900.1 uncharacterised protein [Saccharolobus solfataricus]
MFSYVLANGKCNFVYYISETTLHHASVKVGFLIYCNHCFQLLLSLTLPCLLDIKHLVIVSKGAVILILITLFVYTLNIISNAYLVNVKILSPFPITLMFSDSQGVKLVSSNQTLNVSSSNLRIQVFVLSPYSYCIFINGNKTDEFNVTLSNYSQFNLTVTVIPKYAFLKVNVVGKGTAYIELDNGSIIAVRNSSVIRVYNGSSVLLEANGDLINWSNGANTMTLWYTVGGNSTITAFFGNSSILPKSGTVKPTVNYTEVGLSLFAVGFFILYKIYSRKDQDTNV